MLSRKRLIFYSVLSFLFFVFFSYLVRKNLFTQFDFNNTVRFQDHIKSQKIDFIFSVLSTVGRVEFVGIFLFLLLALYRKLKYIFVLFLFGFFHLFELYGKTFVKHLPPPHFLLRTQELIPFPAYYVRSENSYPSGHAARALFVSVIIFFLLQKNKKITRIHRLIIYAVLIAYDLTMLVSRIYLGEHWTTDVIGGSILGISFALLSGIAIL